MKRSIPRRGKIVAVPGRDMGYKRGSLGRSLGVGGHWEATGYVCMWVIYAGNMGGDDRWGEMSNGYGGLRAAR